MSGGSFGILAASEAHVNSAGMFSFHRSLTLLVQQWRRQSFSVGQLKTRLYAVLAGKKTAQQHGTPAVCNVDPLPTLSQLMQHLPVTHSLTHPYLLKLTS